VTQCDPSHVCHTFDICLTCLLLEIYGLCTDRVLSCIYTRTSEAKDCSQNANALRPYLNIGMIERSWLFSETTLR
jgi:hypothetical protein